MDQTTSSSSSSSYEHQTTTKATKSLHSVLRKPPPVCKPTTKHFIAPLPPTPLKIYNVEPSNFKEAVRVLTSSPEFQYPSTRRFKDKAPPPLILSAVPKPSLFPKPTSPVSTMSPVSTFVMSPGFSNMLNETMQNGGISSLDSFEDLNPQPVGDDNDISGGAVVSPRGFLSLSPTSLSWCSSILFSPGSLSGMNQSPVL